MSKSIFSRQIEATVYINGLRKEKKKILQYNRNQDGFKMVDEG